MKNFIIYYAYYLWYWVWINYLILTSKDKRPYKSMMLAFKTHHGVRQRYGKKYPYFYHLRMVYQFVFQFNYLLPDYEDKYAVFLAALFHDVIEDCRMTYNDVVELLGKKVADIVFACTELRGRNRKERHGPEFIEGLKNSRLGTFTKMCDICANMTMGVREKSSMLDTYIKEYPKTKQELYTAEFHDIFQYIEDTFITSPSK